MKILLWNECYISGGADWSLIDLINSWPNKEDKFNLFINKSHEGYDLLKQRIKYEKLYSFNTLLENNLLNKLKKKNNIFFFKLIRKLLLLFFLFLIVIEYFKKINNSNFDAIIINNGGYPGSQSAYIVSIICKILKRKKIFMIVRNYPLSTYKESFYMKFISMIVNLFIDKVIVVSDSLLAEMKVKSGIRSNKLIRIYNGINIRDKYDKNSQISFENNSIGIIGNLEKRKGHEVLINSLPTIIKQYPNIKLYIIGSESSGNKNKIERLISDLKIENYVDWIPYQKNIENIYKNLKIIIMPSTNFESFGRIAVEAMAFKRPIIASNVGGLNEIISSYEDGITFENGDSEKLANSVIRLLKDEELYEKIVKNGYKKFNINFTSEIMSKNYYNIINSE